MDSKDQLIIDYLQKGLDICEKPYEKIAKELNITEEEVLNRINKLKEDNILRRISGFFNPAKIGYKSTLAAMKVPEDRLDFTVLFINSFKEVTHNYIRKNDTYNLWFTIIAEDEVEICRIISEIIEETSIDVANFPSTNFYKIKVNF